ncbi:MAG: hypothetical protein RIM84_07205 [Alphaproteobacteria bacterium]
MAFDPAALNVIGYAHGFTLWHYRSADADIDAADYFAAASDLLRPGDFVLATRGPRQDRHGLYAIAGPRPGEPALVTISESGTG